MSQQQKKRASELAEALAIRREEAMECENAKFAALQSVHFNVDDLAPITNRYKALDRLIKWMERKITELCEEN